MSVPRSKQKQSGYKVVDNAIDIYNKTLDICLRMPNRYTYLVLLPILNLAGEVMDYAKKGNSVIPNKNKPNINDVEERRNNFIKAKSSNQALITRLNFFLERPQLARHKINGREVGITESELDKLATMVELEDALLGGTLDKDELRYKVTE